MNTKPLITVVINFYNNEREAPRSLYTLSAQYQQGIEESDYKVIVIDNGSKKPLDKETVEQFGGNFEFYSYTSNNASPCAAMNFAINKADTPYVMCMIDGAHLLSPKVLHYTIKAIKAYDNPVVLTLPLHLGPYMQFFSIEEGYNQLEEDKLLNSIPWKENGYNLFSISNLANYERNFFSGLYESNCFTLKKEELLRHGGFSEKFVSSGGGLINLDVFKKLVEDPALENVTLVGEASFHQFHGGVTTNSIKKEQPLPIYKEEYKEIYGQYYAGPTYQSQFIGQITPESKAGMPKQKWNVYGNIAKRLRSRGKFNEAIEVLNLAKEINPHRPELYTKLGEAYTDLKQWENAKTHFEKAIDISPANEIAQYLGLANVYLKTNQTEKAENTFQKAAIIDPLNASTPLTIARHYIDEKKPKKAMVYLDKALAHLEKRKNEPATYMSVARLFKKLKAPNRALKTANLLLTVKNDQPAPYAIKGTIHFEQKSLKKAEAFLLKALELGAPNPFGIHFQLASIYAQRGALNKGLKYSRLAAEQRPGAPNNNALLESLENRLTKKRTDGQFHSFIFTHIPKCGGTSVRKYLSNIAQENGISTDQIWMPGLHGVAPINNIRVLGFLGEVMPQNLLVLADHSFYNVQEDYNIRSLANPFYFTILREPYDRFVSNYYYFYFTRGQDSLRNIHLNDLSEKQLEKILDKEGHSLIRFLGNFKNDEVLPLEVSKEHLNIAQKNLLEAYQVFGLFEKMGETMEMLESQMPKWLEPSSKLPFLNKNKIRHEEIEIKAAFKEKILNYIQLDAQLYQKATEEFAKRYKAFQKKK